MIKSTKGFTTDTRKGYLVTLTDGTTYEGYPDGSQGYICNGVQHKTLKAFKEWTLEPREAQEVEIVEMNEQGNLWDCIDPCALLIQAGILTKHSMVTLNNHGWLNEDGTPDTDKADRAFKVFEKLSNISID
jgi:hypothetical protein